MLLRNNKEGKHTSLFMSAIAAGFDLGCARRAALLAALSLCWRWWLSAEGLSSSCAGEDLLTDPQGISQPLTACHAAVLSQPGVNRCLVRLSGERMKGRAGKKKKKALKSSFRCPYLPPSH